MSVSPNPETGLDRPPVSLIVTTYTEDRLDNIAHLLESVRTQTLQGVEVVFVGEGTPRLCDHVRGCVSRPAPFRLETVFNPGRPGLSQARNIGTKHARGRILAFIDDDVVLFPDWAEKLVSTFAENPSVIGVSGAALPLWEDPAMAWLPEEFQWLVSCTGWFDGRRGSPLRNAWGMNMGFRREVFAHASFDERLGGNRGARDGSKRGLLAEDAVFSFRVREAMGGRIVFNPEVRVYHKVSRYRLTPRYLRRRAFWEGYTKAVLGREYARNAGDNGAPERRLFARIMLRFLPETVGQLFRRPGVSARRLTFAINTIFYLALGYASARFAPLGAFTRSRFER